MTTIQSTIYVSSTHFVPSGYTGKERDTESGLDYFGARYYASTMNPLTLTDPTGKDAAYVDFSKGAGGADDAGQTK